MKLEFLRSGSPDCPLIRLYEFDVEQARRFRQIALRLANGDHQAVALHAEPGIDSIAGCELTLREGQRDFGVMELAEMKFECVLTKRGWLNVAGLIEPFCRSECPGYQWLTRLTRRGKISLLLSHNGRW